MNTDTIIANLGYDPDEAWAYEAITDTDCRTYLMFHTRDAALDAVNEMWEPMLGRLNWHHAETSSFCDISEANPFIKTLILRRYTIE